MRTRIRRYPLAGREPTFGYASGRVIRLVVSGHRGRRVGPKIEAVPTGARTLLGMARYVIDAPTLLHLVAKAVEGQS